MREQKDIEEMNQIQQSPWLVNNKLFCYKGDEHPRNESEKRQHFLQHKEKHSSSKKAYTDGSKSTGRKVGCAAILTDITRKGSLPEEASIHTTEMTILKIAVREIKKERKHEMGNIYRLAEFNIPIENNRKNHPILNQI